jgi:hypothetical protein
MDIRQRVREGKEGFFSKRGYFEANIKTPQLSGVRNFIAVSPADAGPQIKSTKREFNLLL